MHHGCFKLCPKVREQQRKAREALAEYGNDEALSFEEIKEIAGPLGLQRVDILSDEKRARETGSRYSSGAASPKRISAQTSDRIRKSFHSRGAQRSDSSENSTEDLGELSNGIVHQGRKEGRKHIREVETPSRGKTSKRSAEELKEYSSIERAKEADVRLTVQKTVNPSSRYEDERQRSPDAPRPAKITNYSREASQEDLRNQHGERRRHVNHEKNKESLERREKRHSSEAPDRGRIKNQRPDVSQEHLRNQSGEIGRHVIREKEKKSSNNSENRHVPDLTSPRRSKNRPLEASREVLQEEDERRGRNVVSGTNGEGSERREKRPSLDATGRRRIKTHSSKAGQEDSQDHHGEPERRVIRKKYEESLEILDDQRHIVPKEKRENVRDTKESTRNEKKRREEEYSSVRESPESNTVSSGLENFDDAASTFSERVRDVADRHQKTGDRSVKKKSRDQNNYSSSAARSRKVMAQTSEGNRKNVRDRNRKGEKHVASSENSESLERDGESSSAKRRDEDKRVHELGSSSRTKRSRPAEEYTSGQKSFNKGHGSNRKSAKERFHRTNLEDDPEKYPPTGRNNEGIFGSEAKEESHKIFRRLPKNRLSVSTAHKGRDQAGSSRITRRQAGSEASTEDTSEKEDGDWSSNGHENCISICRGINDRIKRVKNIEEKGAFNEYVINKAFSYFGDLCNCHCACLVDQLSKDPFVTSTIVSTIIFGIGLKLCCEMDGWKIRF